MKKYALTIGWLYPDLMSIYGDRGNIIALQKRCEWRDISVKIAPISLASSEKELVTCDLLMMGGAQDSQQTIVAKDLERKKKALSEMIESGVPGLYICGGFQFLGNYYKEADGTTIEQLGVLDIYTENPGRERLIGNIAVELSPVIASEVKNLYLSKKSDVSVRGSFTSVQDNNYSVIIGFENHGGRTMLGKNVEPLGKVIVGFGSNDAAKEEGAIYKNSIGTYLHGPILPKNPEIADWLLEKALEKKCKQKISLIQLDDSLTKKARDTILARLEI